jgi:hypothetical protein
MPMAKQAVRTQRDLFEAQPMYAAIEPEQWRKAVEQLQTLLLEAVTTVEERPEVDHDQDHA